MNKKASVISALIALLGGGTWVGGVGAVTWMDSRYAPVEAVADVQWTTLKKEIRELRDDIERAKADGNSELAKRLESDLQDTIDRLCKSFKDDRECKKED